MHGMTSSERTRPAIQAPRARYTQIADLLRSRIEDEAYPPGTAMPSEPELAAELGVSRVTINRAIGLLRSAGYVKVRRGAGTYVRSIPRIVRDARGRYGARVRGTGAADAEAKSLGLQPRTDYVEIGPIQASAEIASLLHIRSGATVLVRRRRTFANDEPTQIADSYYPWSIAKGSPLLEMDTGVGGSYGRLADMGYVVGYFTEDVTARIASEAECQILDLDSTQPVFQIIHTAWTEEHTPIEVAVHVMSASIWTLRYEWEDQPPPSRRR